ILGLSELLKPAIGKGRPICFVLAGDGELRHGLEAQIKLSTLPVKLLGFVNVDELPNVYCCADILVHPAEIDPHPLVLSEAAAIGLPLVISDRVGAHGPTDVARMNRNTKIFKCGNLREIASHITRLMDDEELRNQMSAASMEIFQSQDLSESLGGLMRA